MFEILEVYCRNTASLYYKICTRLSYLTTFDNFIIETHQTADSRCSNICIHIYFEKSYKEQYKNISQVLLEEHAWSSSGASFPEDQNCKNWKNELLTLKCTLILPKVKESRMFHLDQINLEEYGIPSDMMMKDIKVPIAPNIIMVMKLRKNCFFLTWNLNNKENRTQKSPYWKTLQLWNNRHIWYLHILACSITILCRDT